MEGKEMKRGSRKQDWESERGREEEERKKEGGGGKSERMREKLSKKSEQ